jgi:hypothetical protein
LCALGVDLAAMVVLTETKSRSYDLIWRENKNRYRSTAKTKGLTR